MDSNGGDSRAWSLISAIQRPGYSLTDAEDLRVQLSPSHFHVHPIDVKFRLSHGDERLISEPLTLGHLMALQSAA